MFTPRYTTLILLSEGAFRRYMKCIHPLTPSQHVYGLASEPTLRKQLEGNLNSLSFFLLRHGPPDLKISFIYRIAFGQNDTRLCVRSYRDLLPGPWKLHLAQRDVTVIVHGHLQTFSHLEGITVSHHVPYHNDWLYTDN